MEHRTEFLRRMLGKYLHIQVDRPIGWNHHGLIYPVNYGYIPGMMAGDGEEQDVYILGVSHPLTEFEGIIIGGILRRDDCEDKLIAAPAGMMFTREQMEEAVRFQERFFDSSVVCSFYPDAPAK